MDEVRRRFLKGVTVGVVVGAFGAGVPVAIATNGGRREAYWKLPEKWDLEADVVVVGFGAAGAAAAIEAASKGASVLVLDKVSTPGGTTLMAGGSFGALNSSEQEAKNLRMDIQDRYKQVLAEMKKLHWVQTYPEERDLKFLANSGKELGDWLQSLGIKFASVTNTSMRAEGGGTGLTSFLQKTAKSKGAKVEIETRAVQLIARPDTKMVLGVVAEQGDAKIFVKARKGVVLAAGGFSANKEMLKHYSPVGYASLPVTAASSTGDGIVMAQSLGAALSGMEIASGPPAVLKTASRMQYFGAKISSIFVNERGNRFCDEGGPAEEINDAVFNQPGSHAWLVTDETQVKKSKGSGIEASFSENLAKEVSAGIVMKAASVDELAKAIKVDSENLRTTLEKWNAWAKADKKDREWGRIDKPAFTFSPMVGPTYYGVEIVPGISETLGGLVADGESRVIDVNGKPIPRLYAGGDIVREGKISTLGESMFFGKIAGRSAASEVSWT